MIVESYHALGSTTKNTLFRELQILLIPKYYCPNYQSIFFDDNYSQYVCLYKTQKCISWINITTHKQNGLPYRPQAIVFEIVLQQILLKFTFLLVINISRFWFGRTYVGNINGYTHIIYSLYNSITTILIVFFYLCDFQGKS